MDENKQNPRPPKRRGEDTGEYARPSSSKPESASKPAKAAYEDRGRDRASSPRESASEAGHEPGKFRDDPQRSPEAGRKVGGGREDS
jgi:general stress protein YciG